MSDLPPPPLLKKGWPWTLPVSRNRSVLVEPRISVVTPTYQQGDFLEEMIRSVLGQRGVSVELIIIDGGSGDQTLAVIEKYQPWLAHWESGKDRGQAHAINKGFARATGEWVAWMNSDDLYEPDALLHLVEAAARHPEADVIFGNKDSFNQDGSFRQAFYAKEPSFQTMLPWQCLYSETCFFRRSTVLRDNYLDESYQHYMDCEFFWRLFLKGKIFRHVPTIKARWRIHEGCKSIRGKERADEERFRILEYVYNAPETPARQRSWIRHNLRMEALNTFGKRRFHSFRSQVKSLGLEAGGKLWIRYFASYLPGWKQNKEASLDLNIRNQAPYEA